MAWSYKDWYDKNKLEVSERRKTSYHTKPKYRAKVLKRNKATRQAKRAEAQDGKYESNQRIDHGDFFSVKVGGVTHFTIGALAGVLGCTRQAIRQWERQGVLPAMGVRRGEDSRGVRLFTLEQILQIRSLLQAAGRLRPDTETKHPRTLWREVEFKRRGRKATQLIELFRLGFVAKVVSRALFTLTQMERSGVLPATTLRIPVASSDTSKAPGSIRLYTGEMVEALAEAFKDLPDNASPEEQAAFTAQVTKAWTALGMLGAQVVTQMEEIEDDGSEKEDSGPGSSSEAAL